MKIQMNYANVYLEHCAPITGQTQNNTSRQKKERGEIVWITKNSKVDDESQVVKFEDLLRREFNARQNANSIVMQELPEMNQQSKVEKSAVNFLNEFWA
jgi:hypothetical protein